MQGTSGFEFRDIQSLNIAYLEFTGCENGGAMGIIETGSVHIRDCHFTDNNGGAINVRFANIYSTSNHYINNSDRYGGAISVISANFYIVQVTTT